MIGFIAADQARQLDAIAFSTDGYCQYRPCQATLVSGQTLDRVVFTEVNGFERIWGSDPARKIVAIEDVVRIVDSPVRLPADLANQIYEAGESGMGYVIFTVNLRDGRTLPYVTGNLVDFPALQPGIGTGDIAHVVPHHGRHHFRNRSPHPSESSAPYLWCPYRLMKT